MDWRRTAGIAAGGVLGATVRWAVLTTVTVDGPMPWPVLGVNVIGSAVLGILLAEEWNHPRRRLWFHDIGGIGFCGGLTTFSTFTVEIVDLVRRDAIAVALSYGVLSVSLSIAGVLAGAALLRRIRAVAQPLEGQP